MSDEKQKELLTVLRLARKEYEDFCRADFVDNGQFAEKPNMEGYLLFASKLLAKEGWAKP